MGAGSIVNDAHLPAYRATGLEVIAIADMDQRRAERVAAQFGIPRSFGSVEEAVQNAPRDCVFDVAVPAPALVRVLSVLPEGSAVLMQKPMGETLEEARTIVELCRARRFTAAVNFQLRFAPNMAKALALRAVGDLGQLHDFQVDVSCHMPWETWSFLAKAPRLEILYHSIHYLDLARAWMGEPAAVQARTVRSPVTPDLSATKSSIVLDYGDWTRALIATNHSNGFGMGNQRSFVQVEGTLGAVHAQMGVNLDYPRGLPDTLDVSLGQAGWQPVPLGGNWFPEAFAGSMNSLQNFLASTTDVLPTRVDDAFRTMALVEACYESSRTGRAIAPNDLLLPHELERYDAQ